MECKAVNNLNDLKHHQMQVLKTHQSNMEAIDIISLITIYVPLKRNIALISTLLLPTI